jgi:hypothetical protein
MQSTISVFLLTRLILPTWGGVQKLFFGHAVGFFALGAAKIIMYQVFLMNDVQGLFNTCPSYGNRHFTAVAAYLHNILTKSITFLTLRSG